MRASDELIPEPLTVDFYFGVGSRYSYLASTQLPIIEREAKVSFNWIAINSMKLIAARKDNPFATLTDTGPYSWNYRRQDAEAWADFYGVPFLEPHGRLNLDPDLLSLACTAARRLGMGTAYAQELFRAVFAESFRAIGRDICIKCAEKVGLDTTIFDEQLSNSDTRVMQDSALEEATRHGVFGVPTFRLRNRLIWGNDRLILLRHAIRKLQSKDGCQAD